MTILVTGAAGFIGAALVLRLLERGDTVIGLDNHNSYYDPALKEARLARFAHHPRYTHIRLDLADREGVKALFTSTFLPPPPLPPDRLFIWQRKPAYATPLKILLPISTAILSALPIS